MLSGLPRSTLSKGKSCFLCVSCSRRRLGNKFSICASQKDKRSFENQFSEAVRNAKKGCSSEPWHALKLSLCQLSAISSAFNLKPRFVAKALLSLIILYRKQVYPRPIPSPWTVLPNLPSAQHAVSKSRSKRVSCWTSGRRRHHSK